MKALHNDLNGKSRLRLVALFVILALLPGILAGCASAQAEVHSQNLSEPLNSITKAKVDIDAGDGSLIVDKLTGSDQVLASGTLQYLEGQDFPTQSLTTSSGQSSLTLKAGQARQSGFRLPWEACLGFTEWQVYLNPGVLSEITAHSNGGNVRLNLTGTTVTHVAADTGGGNMDVALPDSVKDINVTAKTGGGDVTVEIGRGMTGSSTITASSGAGNVVVRLPDGIAARVHTTSGMGKTILDARFNKVDDNTYQTADFNSAANKVEITLNSGAGNVSVETK